MTRRERNDIARAVLAEPFQPGPDTESRIAVFAAEMTRPRRSRQLRSSRRRAQRRNDARRAGGSTELPGSVAHWQGPTGPRGCWRPLLIYGGGHSSWRHIVTPFRGEGLSDKTAHRYSALGRAR